MQIRPVTTADMPDLLALIADYQRFYAGSARDDAHNAAFFGRFVAASEHGASHLRWFTARRAQRLYERVGAERSSWFAATRGAVHSSVDVGGIGALICDEALDDVAATTLATFAENLEALLRRAPNATA